MVYGQWFMIYGLQFVIYGFERTSAGVVIGRTPSTAAVVAASKVAKSTSGVTVVA